MNPSNSNSNADASLANKIALVTGGSKGIGKATTLALVKAGAKVAFVYASDVASADGLLKELGEENALAIRADASSVAGAQEMVEKTIARFGRLDVVVLCAGTSPMNDIWSTTEHDFDRAIQMNVKGPYFIAQKCAAVMSRPGNIIFISSALNHYSTVHPSFLLYCTCKGAIEQMTRVLSRDLARQGIMVNAVAPGPVDGEHFRKGKSEEMIKTISNAVPSGRLADAQEVADVLLWLCGGGARRVNGQVVRVDGGMT